MKKSKNKKFFLLKIIGFTLLSIFFTEIAYGMDVISDYIEKQTSNGFGSNNIPKRNWFSPFSFFGQRNILCP